MEILECQPAKSSTAASSKRNASANDKTESRGSKRTKTNAAYIDQDVEISEHQHAVRPNVGGVNPVTQAPNLFQDHANSSSQKGVDRSKKDGHGTPYAGVRKSEAKRRPTQKASPSFITTVHNALRIHAFNGVVVRARDDQNGASKDNNITQAVAPAVDGQVHRTPIPFEGEARVHTARAMADSAAQAAAARNEPGYVGLVPYCSKDFRNFTHSEKEHPLGNLATPRQQVEAYQIFGQIQGWKDFQLGSVKLIDGLLYSLAFGQPIRAMYFWEYVSTVQAAGFDVRKGPNGESYNSNRDESTCAAVPFDFTAFEATHQTWCKERGKGRPAILTDFKPPPGYKAHRPLPTLKRDQALRLQDGTILLNATAHPIRDLKGMPLTLSSRIQDWVLAAMQRLHTDRGHPDLRDRVAPLLSYRSGTWVDGRLPKTTFNKRVTAARETYRLMTWPFAKHDKMTEFDLQIEYELSQQDFISNTTGNLADLTTAQAKALTAAGQGKAPKNSGTLKRKDVESWRKKLDQGLKDMRAAGFSDNSRIVVLQKQKLQDLDDGKLLSNEAYRVLDPRSGATVGQLNKSRSLGKTAAAETARADTQQDDGEPGIHDFESSPAQSMKASSRAVRPRNNDWVGNLSEPSVLNGTGAQFNRSSPQSTQGRPRHLKIDIEENGKNPIVLQKPKRITCNAASSRHVDKATFTKALAQVKASFHNFAQSHPAPVGTVMTTSGKRLLEAPEISDNDLDAVRSKRRRRMFDTNPVAVDAKAVKMVNDAASWNRKDSGTGSDEVSSTSSDGPPSLVTDSESSSRSSVGILATTIVDNNDNLLTGKQVTWAEWNQLLRNYKVPANLQGSSKPESADPHNDEHDLLSSVEPATVARVNKQASSTNPHGEEHGITNSARSTIKGTPERVSLLSEEPEPDSAYPSPTQYEQF